MEITYQVIADNCNSTKITFEKRGLTKNTAKYVAKVMCDAFRDVRVICEQTGEIMFNKYYNDDFFPTTIKEVEAIVLVQSILAD